MSLRATNVTYHHPGADGLTLDGVDLTVEPGQITALVGPSGAGKSTLARLLVGLLTPESGAITCDGVPVGARRGRLPSTTALLTQDPLSATDPRHTLNRTISLPAALTGRPIATEAAAREVGLTPDLLARRPRDVSGGQLQRACLARALAQRPRYLIADEPTAHLDPITAAAISTVLTQHAADGLGVLLITHDQALAHRISDTTKALEPAAVRAEL